MTDDLVKRLEEIDFDFRDRGYSTNGFMRGAIRDAIAALRERDKARDEVLGDGNNASLRRVISEWLFAYNDRDPRQDENYDVEAEYGADADSLIARIRALKPALTPKVDYTGWTCGKCGEPVAGPSSTCEKCGFSPKARQWTRADGTTSPVRSGVVDRRESAYGDICAGWKRDDGCLRGPLSTAFGRRAGDRERWTGEKVATPQPEQPSLEEDRRPARVIAGKHEKAARESAQRFVDAVMDHVNAELDRRLAALEKK